MENMSWVLVTIVCYFSDALLVDCNALFQTPWCHKDVSNSKKDGIISRRGSRSWRNFWKGCRNRNSMRKNKWSFTRIFIFFYPTFLCFSFNPIVSRKELLFALFWYLFNFDSRTMYNMCTQRNEEDYPKQLYEKYKEAIEEYLTVTVRTITNSFFNIHFKVWWSPLCRIDFFLSFTFLMLVCMFLLLGLAFYNREVWWIYFKGACEEMGHS